MTANEWNVRYSAIRQAKDRTLLQELERQIEAEEKAAKATPVDRDAERRRIALAFGRPLV
jgi:hypothetical protein